LGKAAVTSDFEQENQIKGEMNKRFRNPRIWGENDENELL